MDTIKSYFPDITSRQEEQFQKLAQLYKDHNRNVNVVSRKDIDNIEINHILHSLSIAKFIKFTPGSRIVDLGTGGGLPGLPLAIIFPDVHFHLIDRVGKKINVAKSIADELGLSNVSFQHGDMGECHEKFDFVVSRAVTDMPTLIKISKKNISNTCKNALPNGIITLKGGELHQELGNYAKISEVVPVSNYFDLPFFDTKKIVFTPMI